MKRKHLTSLHEAILAYEQKHREQSESPARQHKPKIDKPQERKPFVGMMNQTGAGYHQQSLSVVPVKVKGNCGQKEVATYALLEDLSTATFNTKDFLGELGVATTRCHLSLATVNNVVENCDGAMASLKITNLEGNVLVEILQAFAINSLNISH